MIERERKRLAQEKRAARIIAEAMGEQLRLALHAEGGPSAAALSAGDAVLTTAILQALQEATMLGIEAALDDLGAVGISIDWALVNEAARDWAREYAYSLVRDIDTTSRDILQKEIAQWLESGEHFDKLTETLSSFFDERRARLIAMTETTRAYNEANIIAWRESGLADRDPEVKPPLHPGCRCELSINEADNGDWVYIWNTANDYTDGIVGLCDECMALGDRDNVGVAKEKQ